MGTPASSAPRAALYLRVSTRQQRQLRRLAELHGFSIVRVYRERRSAFKERPSHRQLMADAAMRSIDVVVVWSMDRFARSLVELLACVDRLDERKVRFDVIGDSGGAEAIFNKGTSITVKLAITDGSKTAPTCAAKPTAAVRDVNLLAKLRLHVPSRALDSWRDELGADVALGQLLLQHGLPTRAADTSSNCRKIIPESRDEQNVLDKPVAIGLTQSS